MVRVCARSARGHGFKSHQGQLSVWNRKTSAQNEYHIYHPISLYTSMINLGKQIQNIGVETDKGPSPKLALSRGGGRANIEC